MITSWESIGDTYFVIHHFAALYAYYYVLVSCFQLVWCTMTSSRSPRSFCTSFYFCRVKGYCLTLLISACFQNSPPPSWTNGKYLNIKLKAFNATVTWAHFLIALFLMNFSWFFHMLGYHKLSKPSLVNGVAMAFAFFLVRIAVIPGYYSHMYSVFGTDDFYRLTLGGRSAWVISSVTLDVMNIMWMRRIIRGCLKVLRSAWSRKTGTEMETRKTDWQGDTDRKLTHQHKNLLSLSCPTWCWSANTVYVLLFLVL